MTTLCQDRKPAKLMALKQAKMLELYTIKKVRNERAFSKKKYRRSLIPDILKLTKDCYTYLVKAHGCEEEGEQEDAFTYKRKAILNLEALSAQLDVANVSYSTSIPSIDYWTKLIVETEDSIKNWIKNTRK